jgi:hypothetical protein
MTGALLVTTSDLRTMDADRLGCAHWGGGMCATTFITQRWIIRKESNHLPQSALGKS